VSRASVSLPRAKGTAEGVTHDRQEPDESRQGLDEAELDEETGEELPPREALSLVDPVGDSLGPPPVAE
jgi:hypothetical protein